MVHPGNSSTISGVSRTEAEHPAAPGFCVGDVVRVHTGEVGVIARFIPGTTKCVHVLTQPGLGGLYFPFECEKTGDWRSAVQLEEMESGQ